MYALSRDCRAGVQAVLVKNCFVSVGFVGGGGMYSHAEHCWTLLPSCAAVVVTVLTYCGVAVGMMRVEWDFQGLCRD